MILLGNDIKIAIGISIMQMIFSSIYGSYINYRQNNLEFKDSLYVGLGGLIGAAFSGIVVDRIPSNILEGFFTPPPIPKNPARIPVKIPMIKSVRINEKSRANHSIIKALKILYNFAKK